MSSFQGAASYIRPSSLSVRYQISLSQKLCMDDRCVWRSLQRPLLEKDAQFTVVQVKQSRQS